MIALIALLAASTLAYSASSASVDCEESLRGHSPALDELIQLRGLTTAFSELAQLRAGLDQGPNATLDKSFGEKLEAFLYELLGPERAAVRDARSPVIRLLREEATLRSEAMREQAARERAQRERTRAEEGDVFGPWIEDRQIATQQHRIDSISVSPDGLHLLVGAWDRSLNLWELSTGARLNTWTKKCQVLAVAYRPDGLAFVSASAGALEIQSAKTGEDLGNRQVSLKTIAALAWHPNGEAIAVGAKDGAAYLVDGASDRILHTFKGHSDWSYVSAVALSPNGEILLEGANDGKVGLWDTQSGALIGDQLKPGGVVVAAAFSPDGSVFATSALRDVVLWNTNTQQPLHRLVGHSELVRSLAFSPDGKLVLTGANDSTARIWDAETGQLIQVLGPHPHWVGAVSFTPDGRQIVVGDYEGNVTIWRRRSAR
jgi:WD40 repeat protein